MPFLEGDNAFVKFSDIYIQTHTHPYIYIVCTLVHVRSMLLSNEIERDQCYYIYIIVLRNSMPVKPHSVFSFFLLLSLFLSPSLALVLILTISITLLNFYNPRKVIWMTHGRRFQSWTFFFPGNNNLYRKLNRQLIILKTYV